MNIYREKLLDHYNNPRNFGKLADADESVTLANVSCGDTITLYIKVEDNKISKVSFEGEGCAVAIACASMLTEWAIGKTIKEINDFSLEDFLDTIGLEFTISRLKCAGLGLESLKNCTTKIIANLE